MKKKIASIEQEIQTYSIKNSSELEKFRIEFLGSKNKLKDLFGELKTVPNEQKKEVGQLLNGLRSLAEEKFNSVKDTLDTVSSEKISIDF